MYSLPSVNSERVFQTSNNHIFDVFSHNIKIVPNDALVDLDTFKNYFSTLSDTIINTIQVIAFKIHKIEVIFSRASSEEFHNFLHEVASSIKKVIKTNSYTMAYAGNGLFFVISNRSSTKSVEFQETEIQSLLDQKHLEYNNSEALDIQITVGNPIWPSINPYLPKDIIFSRAAVRAENRAARKDKVSPLTNTFPSFRYLTTTKSETKGL
jgi:hypothetical protein